MELWEIVIAIVAAVGGIGGLGAFFNSLTAAKKQRVEALTVIITTLQGEVARLNTENESLREELGVIRRAYDEINAAYQNVLIWARERGYCPPDDIVPH